ncbi:hypothetical protein IQ273_18890 [Nodosilinea sp. LEGE 07298]|nr:hypothetical protein [Nodosilinea sp. LEGE 07298]
MRTQQNLNPEVEAALQHLETLLNAHYEGKSQNVNRRPNDLSESNTAGAA